MGAESGLRRRVKGLSEAEFRRRFGTEAQCRAALFQLRWGKGWACPGCGHGGYAELKGRAVYQCNRCKRQVGLTAGTVFHWTKLPLTTWFLAIYHLSQSKGGMSSVELARRLGTRQPTAWLIKHKLMAAMQAREAEKPKLGGRVEMDDAYLGGQRSGRQARPGCRGQDAVRRGGRDDGRAQAQAARAHGGQGLPQEGDRAAGQARSRRRQQRRDRRPVLLDGGQQAGCDHFPMVTGCGPTGRQVGALHLGQHRARQHQDGTRRHLPSCQRQARPALSFQLRLALQPPLPARYPDRALGLRLRTDQRRIPTGSSSPDE